MTQNTENRLLVLEKRQKDQAWRVSALKSAIDKLHHEIEVLKNTPPASPTETVPPTFFNELQEDVAMLKSFCAHPSFWDNNANSQTITWQGLRPMEIYSNFEIVKDRYNILIEKFRVLLDEFATFKESYSIDWSALRVYCKQIIEEQDETIRENGAKIRILEENLNILSINTNVLPGSLAIVEDRVETQFFEQYEKQKKEDQYQFQKLRKEIQKEKEEIRAEREKYQKEQERRIEKMREDHQIEMEKFRKEILKKKEEVQADNKKFETQRKQDQIQIDQLQSELQKPQLSRKDINRELQKSIINGEWKLVSFSENCSEYSARNSKMWNEMRWENLKFQLNSNRFDTFLCDSNTGKWELLARKFKFRKTDYGRSRWYFENGTIQSVNLNGKENCIYSILENGQSLRIDSEMGGVKSHRIYHRI